MAKTYINTVKYVIKMTFEVDGIVDKPDIIGAIFGQSEGLLGDEMDLKELQKNGKLGRIEINHTTSMGRTKGEVLIPSSIDMAETSLLAAGIETVDKVGPCEAKFKLIDIEDTRTEKRQEIKDRAKEILKRLMEKSSPETQMLSDEIRENARAADIIEFGPDKLPAGPEVETSEEIIIVEGRADVLNLLRNQIKNVIGMNGSNIAPSLAEITKAKTVTAFADGDRGGILNVRKLMQMAKVDFVAQAPDGKEVEELTRKEILLSLKKKKPASELEDNGFQKREFQEHGFRERRPERPPYQRSEGYAPRGEYRQRGEGYSPRGEGYQQRGESGYGQRGFRDRRGGRTMGRGMGRHGMDRGRGPMRGGWEPRREMHPRVERTPFSIGEDSEPRAPPQRLSQDEEGTFKPFFEGLKGTMNAKILGQSNEVLKEIKVKDVVKELSGTPGANAIVFDGVITKRLIEAAEKSGAKYVIGAKKGKIENTEKVKAITL